MTAPTLSLVIPIYNEAETIPELGRRLKALLKRLKEPTEVILVNDGSHDDSLPLLVDLNRRDPRFKVVNLSRNFGHQLAITAGMDLASGEAVIVMDADLQDPPEVVTQLVRRWREGYQIVHAVRRERRGETWFKRWTAHLFYRFLQSMANVDLIADAGDFRLIDRQALEALRSLRESNRYVRGMVSWLGFRQTTVEYVREERFAGTTKYPLRKMLRFATDALISFSNVPLRFALNIGFVFAALSFLGGLLAIGLKLAGAFTIPGWVSIVVGVTFVGGVQLFILGVMGEYLGRIYEQVKARPLYIVSDLHGSFDTLLSVPRAVVTPPAGAPAPIHDRAR
ncbi:glycosyltransferase family 2 protein [Candidatus Berkelbacteria bacterium]|nr:glycosyltransferase family 2 protein [Candidatus Berkelbacteria bacterium]